MSVIMDFSFNNPMIKDYFNGDDSYTPSAELLYIHNHPLVSPNFVSEIERMINVTSEYMLLNKYKEGILNRFVLLTQSLGKVLPISSEDNAAEALKALRNVYKFCKQITEKG